MTEVLQGGSIVAAFAIALFFYRFWRETRDRFFVLFAIAFALFALNRIVLVAVEDDSEAGTLALLGRLGAFGLIIAAIVDKNRSSG